MRSIPALFLALISVSFVTSQAFALPAYPANVPNGTTLSCPTCHNVDSPTGGCAPGCLNPFGLAFRVTHTWSASLAAMDSDGDGWTNGQELLDRNGTWTVGSANPGPTGEARLPGWNTSTCASRPRSCSLDECDIPAENDCDTSPAATCVESYYFSCTCPTGYMGDGHGSSGCQNINECAPSTACRRDLGNSCMDLTPRYDCTCISGYQLSNNGTYSETCVDVNECLSNPCGVGTCSNSTGSYSCSCPSGYTFSGGTCTNVNECATPGRCGAAGIMCTDTPGSYSCTCMAGYAFDGVSCVLANACTANIDDCVAVATCNAMGAASWTCTCPSGYSGNGRSPPGGTGCTDLDECTLGTPCGVGGTCTNTPGAWSCSCFAGYIATAGTCADVDECGLGTPCGLGSCTNTSGSYTCSCPAGYTFSGGTCTDVNECATPATCGADVGAGTCSNVPGGYSCACNSGFQDSGSGLSATCVDIDECPAFACGAGTCVNSPGSFRCDCFAGYRAAGAESACVEVDECAEGMPCGGGGTCTNIVASYLCDCFEGSRLESGTCVDVDECADPGVCGASSGNGRCVNTPGIYNCECNSGYELVGGARDATCVDIDECARDTDGCDSHARCDNGIGTVTCTCLRGYEGDGRSCTDVDECALGTDGCDEHGTCRNTDGDYECECAAGYESVGRACLDVDECSDNGIECGENEACVNVVGGMYQCECAVGFERNEATGGCDSSCGNGQRVRGEQCDDGNTVDGDGCDHACRMELGYACFENTAGTSTCDDTCGNGALEPLSGEECDRGDDNSDTAADGCRMRCLRAHCGDGVVDTGEQCDDGVRNSDRAPDACRLDCRRAYCGDGVLDAPEVCDRGDGSPCSFSACFGDGSVDGSDGGGMGPKDDGGCDCSVPGQRRDLTWLLALVALLVLRRRKKW